MQAVTRAAVLLATLGSAPAQDYYVDHARLASGDGKTWKTAFKTLKDAVAVARSGQEIWMSYGAHRAGVKVPAGVTIRGNFRRGDTSLEQRNWSGYTSTFLTGYTSRVLEAGDGALIEGVRLSYGFAPAPGGGAVLCEGTAPIFRNCYFSHNEAQVSGSTGSAVLCIRDKNGRQAAPLFENCTFANNGDRSGIMPVIDVHGSTVIFRNCGVARGKGDGIRFDNSSVVGIQNSWFYQLKRAVNDPGRTSRAFLENNLFWPVVVGYRGQDLKSIQAINALGHATRNIGADPKLNVVANFIPLAGSPLVDNGANLSRLPQKDWLGQGRRTDGDLNGVATVDIGPVESIVNRMHVFGSPTPGGSISITLLDATVSHTPTIMAIGARPLRRGFYLDPLGYWFLDVSQGQLIVPWGKTASSQAVKVPTGVPLGTRVAFQNLAVGARGASLSNLFEVRIR